ncbi:hypothetical protein HXX76_002306 [Chlamydomonas incerta]|uniref:Uncharacterized protein n=1 Tax=Chlamydomonas incerta TaxID=51695 RepID=A0A835WAW3_CHLIN|nr:hypothetical protein HXX76_014813 [Chlamydomonas incerta]KAG2443968.1 hypothetical protein HXX76_002306 [Chlamydomonas incerta]|eukprot:KAG2423987.1 hypothetical protein HXX76_014813 [Chlamydomonas incerta]
MDKETAAGCDEEYEFVHCWAPFTNQYGVMKRRLAGIIYMPKEVFFLNEDDVTTVWPSDVLPWGESYAGQQADQEEQQRREEAAAARQMAANKAAAAARRAAKRAAGSSAKGKEVVEVDEEEEEGKIKRQNKGKQKGKK